MLEEVNTCYPAKVVSFDAVTQTVSCKLSIETYFTDRRLSYTKMNAPLLIDVPVHTLQGGGWSITFPIKEGDDCLVLFAQRGYDHWLYSGAQETGLIDGQPTADHLRAFSIRDAICLVGIKPIPSAIQNYSSEDVELRNTDRSQRVVLKANGDIEMITGTNINVNANVVNINSKEANVVADKVDVQSQTTKIKGTDVTVDCPLTKFTGAIQVAGGISMGGGAKTAICDIKGNLQVQGSGTMTGDFVAAGKSVSTHTHNDAEGRPTSPPN